MADRFFYRALEDRYRGSKETIKARLSVYLPFLAPYRKMYTNCQAIDLGCGRGEWLELLAESGFIEARGVDLDEEMLAGCSEKGLLVEKKDAICALRAIEDASLVVVTGFHIAEHISFEDLQTLVKEAHRVLKPHGLLILETPNAENLVVGTNNFYLDPTHQRPLPHQLMQFLAEYSGFEIAKIIRLQETEEVREMRAISLPQVLMGVSPDYALLAKKTGDAALHGMEFDELFGRKYGASLEELSNRYEAHIQATLLKFESKIEVLWRISFPLRKVYDLIRKMIHILKK